MKKQAATGSVPLARADARASLRHPLGAAAAAALVAAHESVRPPAGPDGVASETAGTHRPGESSRSQRGAPKGQPPRNLSGQRTGRRAHSGARGGGSTEGESDNRSAGRGPPPRELPWNSSSVTSVPLRP